MQIFENFSSYNISHRIDAVWPILFLYTATGKRLIAFLLHQCERQIILTQFYTCHGKDWIPPDSSNHEAEKSIYICCGLEPFLGLEPFWDWNRMLRQIFGDLLKKNKHSCWFKSFHISSWQLRYAVKHIFYIFQDFNVFPLLLGP